MSNQPNRASFMTAEHKKAMGSLPRTHENCTEKTKVNRPGKTAQEKWRKQNRK